MSHADSTAEDERLRTDHPLRFILSVAASLWGHPSSFLLWLCLPALWPMLSVTFWASHDGLHHIFRLASFDAALRSGVLFPRWADQLGFGYGFPVTHYYAPLAYYLAEIFHLAGAGFLDSIKLTYALGFIISALSMYRLARDVVSPRAALLAAAVYVYYPYHIADAYMRGALSEFMALALLPLIVWAARRSLIAEPRRLRMIYALGSATALAALILTHNLSAFLFLPALALYVFLNSLSRALNGGGLGWGLRALLWLAAEVTLAFALAAFYLLPALGEVAWIRAGQVSGSVGDIQTLLTPVTQFISGALLQPYVPDAPASLQHPLSLIVALLGVGAIVIGMMLRKHLSSERLREWRAWVLLAALIIFFMLDGSAPLWASVRPLAFVQFPYRLHAVLALALAMLIGLGVEIALRPSPQPFSHPSTASYQRHSGWESGAGAGRWRRFIPYAALLLLMVSLIVSSLGALNIVPQSLPGHKQPISEAQVNLVGMSEYDYQTALWARLYGGPWLFEYMPAWVTEAREEFFLPRSLSPTAQEGGGWRLAPHIELQQYRPQQRTLRVQSAEPFQLSFHTFYFPAWQVRVDGVPVPTFPAGPLALVSAEVSTGDHTVTLNFESTPLQRAGEIISLLTSVVMMAMVSLRGQHRRLWFSLILVLLVSLLGWRSLDPSMMLLSAMLGTGRTGMRTSDQPQSVAATLENQIDLIAYQTAHSVYRPGDVLELTLYWFARQTPHENFKVFVHLDPSASLSASGAGGRAGQVDAQPGLNFSPTTRWQRGELIADHYRLKISAQALPGPYEIYTGMYRPQSLQNLAVVSARATPDNRVYLGAIEIR